MPKILFISYDGMTDPLGQSQVIPYLAGLTKCGYEITILSCEKRKNYFLHKNEVEGIIKSAGLKWAPITYHKKPTVLSTIYDLMQLKKKARQLHTNERFDMVHTRPGIPALVGLGMKKKFGVKFLNDIREFYADSRIDGGIWNLENFFYKKIYAFFREKEKEAISKNDGIVCLTSAAEKIIKQWPEYRSNLPLRVIPCSVDMCLFDPSKTDFAKTEKLKQELGFGRDDVIISYLGSIGSWYMIEEMMEFFRIVSIKNPQTKFLFISPNKKEEIIKVATNYQLENKIIVRQANRKEVPALLSLSNLSVFFIKPCYSKQSSSPTKHGELMAMGIPVITNSGVGDVAEIVEKYRAGLVIKNFKKEEYELAANLIGSINKFDQTEIRKGATEFYNLETAIEKYKSIYDFICKNNARA